MQTFKHKNVLALLGVSFNSYGQPMVILPYLAKGDLRSYIRNPKDVSLIVSHGAYSTV